MSKEEATDPRFNDAFGYLNLLDRIISIANGYLINGNEEDYYNSLESWYLTVVHRFKMNADKSKSSITIDDVKTLEKLRDASESKQMRPLKRYHEKLEELTQLSGLRMTETSRGPGVLRQN